MPSFVLKPYAHQLKIYNETKDIPRWAYFLEMGTGKSKITIDVLAYWFEKEYIESAIIFAKAGEYTTWPNIEFQKHWPPELKYEGFTYSSATISSRTKQLEFSKFIKSKAGVLKVLFMNIEALSGEKGPDALDKFYSST